MNIQDLQDGSDTSDEDYIPEEKEVVSEVDSDGNIIEAESGDTIPGKRKKLQKKIKVKNKKRRAEEEPEVEIDNTEEVKEKIELSTEEKKKKDDDLWADFMKDTGFKSKGQTSNSTNTEKKDMKPRKQETAVTNNRQNKVKITQVFEFAGEEVKVEKEVSSDSAEARLLGTNSGLPPKVGTVKRSGGLGGISNVLSQLSKKQKISTLEKTKLDWDRFKKEENIDEELQTHNKGKDGYLEKQDFLERADLRRFEIEKELRAVERNKRFTSSV